MHNVSPEPSAELLMNMSRSRRLIVLLSHAYLEQDWCDNNFRSGSNRVNLEPNSEIVASLQFVPLEVSVAVLFAVSKSFHAACMCLFLDKAFCICWRYTSSPSSSCWRVSANA